MEGIANNNGQPELNQSHDIFKCALENGVTNLDTARTYETAGNVIGNF